MHPSVGFASLAKGCVSKEWRFLSDTPLCRLSEKNSGCRKCPQSDLLVSEKELFGRCHHQLILAALLLYPLGIKEGPNGTSLAMHPSVGFASQATGYVNKERRFLSDAPLCRLSDKTSGCKDYPQSDFPVSEKQLFGRCHHQLILAALRLHPVGIKEGPEQHVLNHVPLSGLDSGPHRGPPGLDSGFLGLLNAS